MTGSTVLTPADEGLDPFTLRRRPDNLNGLGMDFGNRVVLSAGAVASVLVKPPRVRREVLRYSGLLQADREELEAFVYDTLDQSVQMFHMQWTPTVNLLTETRRLDLSPPWTLSAASTFPVLTRGVADPFGGLLATRLDFLAGVPGNGQRLVQPTGIEAEASVTYSAGVWLRLVEGASLTDSIRLNARTDEEVHDLFITPTSSWRFYATEAEDFTAGLTNLAWRIYRTDSPSPASAFSVAVFGPQLVEGQATEQTYQHVEQEQGLSRCHIAAPLRWTSREDGVWDLELEVVAVGGT